MRIALVLVLLAACGGGESKLRRSGRPSSPVVVGEAVPIIQDATVVAFWLSAVDTLPEKSRQAIQQEFRRSNDAIENYLSDTDVALVTTGSDTVVVETEDERYLILLSGFDFPFGYLLVEPGYEEEFHTGLMVDEDLESVIDEYFEFESANSGDRKRIAVRATSEGRRAKRRFPLRSSLLATPWPSSQVLERFGRVSRRSRRPH
jgi:hypothetical protein